jgi:hypothetical protein
MDIQRARHRIAFAVIFASLSLTHPALAQWEFFKVADGTTPIPGLQGKTFREFSVPAISGEKVVFFGQSAGLYDSDQAGIFLLENGSLQIVADVFTYIPGATVPVKFWRFDAPVISGGQIAFWGQYPAFPLQEGIYFKDGGPLQVVADVSTLVPGGTGTFQSAFDSRPSIDSGNVAFLSRSPTHPGVYTSRGGVLRVVADLKTPIPSGQGTFASFEEVSISGASVAFVGQGAGQQGVYSDLGGTLHAEADLKTILPGGGPDDRGTASSLRGPALDGENLAFVAFGQLARSAIYDKQQGSLRVVVDNYTQIPGRSWNFDTFEPFISYEGGNLVFWSRAAPPNPYEGIFARYAGRIVKVIDNDDTLDGRDIMFLTFGPRALSGHRIAFKAVFSDFSQGLYVAVAPLSFSDGFESGDLSAWIAHTPM